MPAVAETMELLTKDLNTQLTNALTENIALMDKIKLLTMENAALIAREAEIKANATAAAQAEGAGEVAKAFRDGLAYGKDLFREIRAIH